MLRPPRASVVGVSNTQSERKHQSQVPREPAAIPYICQGENHQSGKDPFHSRRMNTMLAGAERCRED